MENGAFVVFGHFDLTYCYGCSFGASLYHHFTSKIMCLTPKNSQKASKLFDVEPKQIPNVELEFDWFTIWKSDFPEFEGMPKLNHTDRLFLVTAKGELGRSVIFLVYDQ